MPELRRTPVGKSYDHPARTFVQGQFLDPAHPRDERIGAANASERSRRHRRYGYLACH